MENQALECASLLREWAALADVANALARKMEELGGWPGTMRSLAPLLLGALHASCLHWTSASWGRWWPW